MKNSDKIMSWLKRLFVIAGIVVILRVFVFIPFEISGSSMSPTIKPKDALIMTRFGKIKRSDIVVFETNTGERYIKRVIGLPGDQLYYKNDHLYINGHQVEEPYLATNQAKYKENGRQNSPYTSDFTLQKLTGYTTIPAHYYFVMGDNRRFSKDSRSFGLVNQQAMIGKVRCIYYPFSQMKLL